MDEIARTLDQWFDFNLNPVNWALMWSLGAIFALIGAVLSCWTWRQHVVMHRAPDRVAAARWYFRQDLFKAIGMTSVAAAGIAAVFTNPVWARALLFFGGLILTLNQALNLFERWYVMHLGDEEERKERNRGRHRSG